MPILPSVMRVLEEQQELVLNLDDDVITETAKKIAFYSAMLNAAIVDPADDPEEQEEFLAFFKTKLTELIELYQSLVNEKM
jgi:hypothetical protein